MAITEARTGARWETSLRGARACETVRRMSRITALTLASLALLAASAAAWGNFHVDGPRTVRVGHEVGFPTTGLKPHEPVTVNLAPTLTRGGNCCGIDVITNARADAHG